VVWDPHLSWIARGPASTTSRSAGTSPSTTTPPTGPNGVTHPCGVQDPLLQHRSKCPMLL